ncbi:MAG: hypothetical protein QXI36_02095 [Candidatus Bathyarchaeia archaeon]
MARTKFVHKIGLGVLVGIVLFAVFFTAVYGLVISANAIAVASGAAVVPFNPPWAFPLLIGFVGFVIPIAGIISVDFDERETEKAQ